jgi:hypothetical protein
MNCLTDHMNMDRWGNKIKVFLLLFDLTEEENKHDYYFPRKI